MDQDRGRLFDVRDLHVWLSTRGGPSHIIKGISLNIQPGECVALVGESGSGKSVTARAVLGLLDGTNSHTEGSIRIRGFDANILESKEQSMREVRGRLMSMVAQDPMTSLDPVAKVADQLRDTIRLGSPGVSRVEIWHRSKEVLSAVGIPESERVLGSWPHQLSGGMRQRVTLALAIVAAPALLVADEPTTALDVTVQAQVLKVLRDLQQDRAMSMLLITHDMGVVAAVADRVAVMRNGELVEFGQTSEILHRPSHPYTRGLVGSTVTLSTPRDQALHDVRSYMASSRGGDFESEER